MEAALVGGRDMGEDWLQRFEEHEVQFIVPDQGRDENLVRILRRQPGWTIDFEGDGAVVFDRVAACEGGR